MKSYEPWTMNRVETSKDDMQTLRNQIAQCNTCVVLNLANVKLNELEPSRAKG